MFLATVLLEEFILAFRPVESGLLPPLGLAITFFGNLSIIATFILDPITPHAKAIPAGPAPTTAITK